LIIVLRKILLKKIRLVDNLNIGLASDRKTIKNNEIKIAECFEFEANKKINKFNSPSNFTNRKNKFQELSSFEDQYSSSITSPNKNKKKKSKSKSKSPKKNAEKKIIYDETPNIKSPNLKQKENNLKEETVNILLIKEY
jgi:hypothetical protein